VQERANEWGEPVLIADDDDEPEIVRRIREARERRSATYHGYVSGDLDDEAGGRFRVLRKPTVIGGEPVARYPAQPEGSFWRSDPVPTEPPIDGTSEGVRLGYRVDGRAEAAASDPADTDSPPKGGVVTFSKRRDDGALNDCDRKRK
jgi:hypothetical protein